MKRVINFFVNMYVWMITKFLNLFGYGLRLLLKLKGLNPDITPYQKYLALATQVLEKRHDTGYSEDFNFSKYIPKVNRVRDERPSFKFKDKPSWQPKEVVMVTEPALPTLEITVVKDNVKVKEVKPRKRKGVSKPRKAKKSVEKAA